MQPASVPTSTPAPEEPPPSPPVQSEPDDSDHHTMKKPPTAASARTGFIYRISSAVDNSMRNAFFRLGLFVANRPLKVIAVSVIFLALTLIGLFLNFRTESRSEKLWVPQGTVALNNLAYSNSKYGRSNRFTAILFKATDPAKGLATKAAFLEMLAIAEKGYNIVVPPLNPNGDKFNTTITLEERCVKTFDTEGNELCWTNSAFNLFYDTKFIVRRDDNRVDFYKTVRSQINDLTDGDIQSILNQDVSTSFDGSPFVKEEVYSTGKSSSKIQVMNYVQFSINNEVDKDGESIDEEAEALEEKWATGLLADSPGNGVEWFVDSAWGQSDSLSEALSGDIPLLSIGFVLLGIYVIVFLGDFHAVRSHRLLAVTALATTGLAIGSCFGLSSATGMFYGPVHQILPLLIIGIGIDDCFHITRSVDEICRRPDAASKPIPTKIALALSQSGSAITVTSFTNVAVFLLSAISKLPALRFFALWAAIGVFFAWVYAITFYTACITLETRRIEAKRLDCVPCCKPVEEVKELNWFKKAPGGFDRFFLNTFGPFIMRPVVRIVLLVLFFAGFGASIYGCTQLYLKFRFAFFFPSGSSQREYSDVSDEFFQLGKRSYIFVRDSDMGTAENQKRLFALCKEDGSIAKDKWVQSETVNCWYARMLATIQPENGGEVYSPSEFVTTAKAFLAQDEGKRYKDDIIFNKAGTEIKDTRFGFQFVYRESNNDEIDGLQSVRDVAAAAGFGLADDVPAAFPFSFLDVFTEQYAALEGEIGLSLGFASLAVALVCLVLVGHPVVAAVSVLVVGMIIIGVLGLTYYTGINLNSISVITLVLCTGISVDFVVHISRSFLEHIGTRSERAIKSLATMGPPVFYAGFSTFLAIIVLSGAKSYIFRVLFLGFFFLILLAFLHGLILGPILLSLIGPGSFYVDEEDKACAERRLEDRFVADNDERESSSGTSEPTRADAQV